MHALDSMKGLACVRACCLDACWRQSHPREAAQLTTGEAEQSHAGGEAHARAIASVLEYAAVQRQALRIPLTSPERQK